MVRSPSAFAAFAHFAKRLGGIWLPLSPVLISDCFALAPERNVCLNVVGHNYSEPRIVLSAAIMLSELRLTHAPTKLRVVTPTRFKRVTLFLIGNCSAHMRGRKSAGRNIPADVYLRPKRPFDFATFINGTVADNHYVELWESF
jgi:hypothetical protein